MLIILVFAIYVIVTREVRITRSIRLSGQNARSFGIALLIGALPYAAMLSSAMRDNLPAAWRSWPIPQVLYGILFGGGVVALALAFRDRSPEAESPGDAVVHGHDAANRPPG